jgi:hypothetical protein
MNKARQGKAVLHADGFASEEAENQQVQAARGHRQLDRLTCA